MSVSLAFFLIEHKMNVFLHDMRDVGAHAADVFNQLSVYCKATKEWKDR